VVPEPFDGAELGTSVRRSFGLQAEKYLKFVDG
jgi:hypothetical protein